MDAPDLRTETADADAGASPPPPLFVATVWIGVFSIVLYGMFLLFGGFRRGG